MIDRLKGFFSSFFHRDFRQSRGESTSWGSLYSAISYRFRNEALLKLALTHRSYLQENPDSLTSNERLEFLGDAVLGMIVTIELFKRFPKSNEGELTKAKSLVVSRERLAKEAKKIGLGEHIILGTGELRSGGRERTSILSNGYEALVGAMYLDGGLDTVRNLVKKHLLKEAKPLVSKSFHQNYKSWLLEHVQSIGKQGPSYRLIRETGPDHKKEFTIEVRIDRKPLGRGVGTSKKKAEQAAAHEAIKKLGLLEGKTKVD